MMVPPFTQIINSEGQESREWKVKDSGLGSIGFKIWEIKTDVQKAVGYILLNFRRDV